MLGQPQRRHHLAAASGGGLRGGLGHVCILARHEPASTGATSRDGRGRGNRLGAAVAARSGTLSAAHGQAAREPIGGWGGHPPATLLPRASRGATFTTQVLGFFAEPSSIMARHVAVTLR